VYNDDGTTVSESLTTITDINSKLKNIEQVEIVYDKDSSDSGINWGYTSGIQNYVTVSGKDFSKYKYLIIIASASAKNEYQVNIILDLTSYSDTNQFGVSSMGWGSTNTNYQYFVNKEKTSFNNASTYSDGYVTKIEGVY
jgi:hypothetical protein